MASVARAIEQARVDHGLWWESHRGLLEDLEDLSVAAEEEADEYAQRKRDELAGRVQKQQHWLLEMLLAFRPPSSASEEALNGPKLTLGTHALEVKSGLKNAALHISKQLDLDEIQSYIVVSRCLDEEGSGLSSENLRSVAMFYFLERQCLLKCVRLLLTTLCLPTVVEELVQKSLENRLLANVKHALSPRQVQLLDSPFAGAWADETAREQNLLLDILFVVYSTSICVCKGPVWRDMFQTFQELVFEAHNEKLAITQEAKNMIIYVRCQALLLLVEGLNLQSLLVLIHEGISFSDGNHGFTPEELQDLDALVSRLDPSVVSEYGPLLLAWATFICLVSGLPDQAMVLDIEHVVYAQQAYKCGAIKVLAEVLRCEQLKDSDVSSGYKGAVKNLISACQAAYDFDQEDSRLQDSIIELLTETFSGEKELCTKFWDRTSMVDGPLRGFLFSLCETFPQQFLPLLRLLSSLSAGSWSAECVYNFLCNGIPVTCMFCPNQNEERLGSTLHISSAVQIPRCSGLYIPAGAAGHILKRYNDGLALVRWECEHSPIIVLLVCLAQSAGNNIEDVNFIATLLNEILTSNKDLTLALLDIDNSLAVTTARADGRMDKNLRIDVVGSICSVIKNLLGTLGEPRVLAVCVNLLHKFADSCPEAVMSGLEESGLVSASGSRDQRFQSKLEQSFGKSFQTISSVLDIATTLLERGVQRDSLSAFVQFVLHSLLANHTSLKFAQRHERWCLCSKIYQMIVVVLRRSLWVEDSLKSSVYDAMLNDIIIQGVLFHTLTMNAEQMEELFVNRHFRVYEIHALLEVIGTALQLVNEILLHMTNENTPTDFSSSIFCQALFHKSAGSVSLISIITSYLGFHSDSRLQVLSARILEKLCEIGQKARPQAFHVSSYLSSLESRTRLRTLLAKYISEKYANENPVLFYAVLRFLTNATSWQPGMVELILSPWDNCDAEAAVVDNASQNKKSLQTEVLDAVWTLFTRPIASSESNLEILYRLMLLLVSIWQGGTENIAVIQALRKRNSFWETLSTKVFDLLPVNGDVVTDERTLENAVSYLCQASIFQIIAYDMFIESHSAASKQGKDGESNVLLKQITSERIRDILRSCTVYKQIDDYIIRFKAEARTFVIGLVVKSISGDTRGMDPSLVRHLRQLSLQILSHPSFKELLSQYNARGYRHSGSLELLILNDLYYNLQGELDGRQIANRSLAEICRYLIDIKLDTALVPPTRINSADDAFKQGPYDVGTLRAALGLNFWTEDAAVSVKTTESVLYNFERASRILQLCKSQIFAVNAFVDLLNVGVGEKASKHVIWTPATVNSLIEDICDELERALATGEFNDYFPDFLASQSKLLASLLWQYFLATETSSVNENHRAGCAKAIKISFSCMKHVLETCQAQDAILENLLECLLMALEVMSSRQITGLDIADSSLSFLPMLCNMVDRKEFRALSLAAINVLISSFFTSSTWIPVLQAHFPTKSLVSTMALGNDDKSSSVMMSFCLYLSRFKAGAEMLFAAGFLQYILLVKYDIHHEEGPFSMSKTKSSRQILWASGVAIVTALLRALGENETYRTPVLDSTASYFRAERNNLISALAAPAAVVESDGKKMVKHQRAQTSLAFLQEAQYVAALLCELIRQPNATAVLFIRDDFLDVRETVLNLLAYIAREGIVRSAVGEGVICAPVQKQEVAAHRKASTLGSTSAWFLISARGSSVQNTQSLSASAAAANQIVSVANSEYSDSVGVRVYKLVSLLLRFLILQVAHAFQDIEEGRSVGIQGFPELPAPEVLHALQDQVVLVTSEIASSKPRTALHREASETCSMLLSILEKSFYLEACIFRVCGITPNSMRADDLARQLSSLDRATQEHSTLSAAVTSVREIAAVVYPGGAVG